MASPDVAIVGAGIYGCALAHALTRHRLRTAVFERDAEPACGPTRRSGACTRQFYGDARLSALSREALDLAWNRWPAFTGLRDPEGAHDRCGTLVVAPPASDRGLSIIQLPPRVDAVDLFAANLRLAGIRDGEVLHGRALEKRFPGLRLRGVRGLVERASGYFREPAAAARDLARAARRSSFHFGRPVLRVRPAGRSWRLDTPAGPVTAGSVILAAGAWTASLLPRRLFGRHRLRVARPRIAHLGPPALPHPVVADVENGAYFRRRGGSLFAANLAAESETLRHPDDLDPRCDRYPHAERAAARRFRDLSRSSTPGVASVYDVNACDGNPVVDRLAPGLYAAWLFSGHGFKFAPAIAARVASAISTGGEVGLPAFALRR